MMNILIIKVGALGDVVRTSFIAQALKDKYKLQSPKICWLTQEKALPFFLNNPYVDKVFIPENKNSLFNMSWDIVINLEEDEINCRFASSLKFKRIIGFIWKNNKVCPSTSAIEWFNMSMLGEKPQNDILKKRNKKTHRQIISEIIGIVDWKKYEPFLRLTATQRTIAKNFMRRYNLSREDFIVGINTGSADRWPKQLSIEKTIELINRIEKEFKAKIILFGGPNEIERNNEILKFSQASIISAGCGNDLIEFPALVSACNFMITTDSLGLHIALALKRKTICLIGPTSINEIDMYGLGKKVVAKSKCLCCFKQNCSSMKKISLEEIISLIRDSRKEKITLLITAFKEPKISKAIESALNQKTKYDYDIIISCPDEETIRIAKRYLKFNRKISILKDSGKGKTRALNSIFSKIDSDLLILTDGDVYLSDNSVEEIVNMFRDPEIGCVTGKPVPLEDRRAKYGYWANFLFEAANNLRKKSFQENSFLECSGYLFAFRNKFINNIPLDVAEDAVIPYFFWEKGYSIGYAESAKVYVKNVNNWKDWLNQKTRTSKAHESLEKYANTEVTPRIKTFSNEAKGVALLLTYPNNFQEFLWGINLILARAYMWLNVFYKLKIKRQIKVDNWERVESAR